MHTSSNPTETPIMTKFWQLVRESVITQALVTLVLVITVCFMAATGRVIPELLEWSLIAVLCFYFGTKSQQLLNRAQTPTPPPTPPPPYIREDPQHPSHPAT